MDTKKLVIGAPSNPYGGTTAGQSESQEIFLIPATSPRYLFLRKPVKRKSELLKPAPTLSGYSKNLATAPASGVYVSAKEILKMALKIKKIATIFFLNRKILFSLKNIITSCKNKTQKKGDKCLFDDSNKYLQRVRDLFILTSFGSLILDLKYCKKKKKKNLE